MSQAQYAYDHTVSGTGDGGGLLAEAEALFASLYGQIESAIASAANARAAADAARADARNAANLTLDLDDLATASPLLVFTGSGESQAAAAGDQISATFTFVNDSVINLTNASVAMNTPADATVTCDIVDGLVPAGATVTCVALHAVDDADAAAGAVAFEATLTGYLAIGPGNPRARPIAGTSVTLVAAFSVPVVAPPVVPVVVPPVVTVVEPPAVTVVDPPVDTVTPPEDGVDAVDAPVSAQGPVVAGQEGGDLAAVADQEDDNVETALVRASAADAQTATLASTGADLGALPAAMALIALGAFLAVLSRRRPTGIYLR